MGYRRMRTDELYEVYRRWRAEHSVSRMAEGIKCDRKTIREYVDKFSQAGLKREGTVGPKEEVLEVLSQILARTERPTPVREELEKHEQELREMIQDEKEPLKPKTAYEVIKKKYGIQGSYESFKTFVREKDIARANIPRVMRIELPPGKEMQIDYGRVGLHTDPKTKKNRVTWAFCGVLSFCRLPFYQYGYTQKQEEFANSVIDSLEYYGGSTERIGIDNLKSGVIKPDLWDPTLNKTLAETMDYYGVFIDPCRVRKATDKGKVERQVPLARELFRMLKRLYPEADLDELNEHAGKWCREEYGQREHGTTKIAPMYAFEKFEKEKLKPLPEERFETPVWKEVKSHRGDGFFTFDNRRYAAPNGYRGKQLSVRYAETSRILRVFCDYRLIREYVVGSKTVNYFPEDFPEGKREMMNGGYPKYLLREAKGFGPEAHALVESVLQPHAYLNARRAQGMLEVMKKYGNSSFFADVCLRALRRGVKLPSRFRSMLEQEESQLILGLQLHVSETGRQMVRDIGYYISDSMDG